MATMIELFLDLDIDSASPGGGTRHSMPVPGVDPGQRSWIHEIWTQSADSASKSFEMIMRMAWTSRSRGMFVPVFEGDGNDGRWMKPAIGDSLPSWRRNRSRTR